jgi:SRSO17 transposase
MNPSATDWNTEFDRWLEPFLDALGHKARQRWAPTYLRGLIAPGDRKSIRPLCDRIAPGEHEQIHHFVATSTWDTSPLETLIAKEAQRLVGGENAVLIVDDTTLPKKGDCSVGVGHQYSGTLGKMTNCQCLVSITLAQFEVPVPIALRLFLPSEWTSNLERCAQAGVPKDCRAPRTKGEIALEQLDRVRASGIEFGVVVADAGYGSADFRKALSARRLTWAVGVPRVQKVYPLSVRVLPPPKHFRGRKPKHPLVTEDRLSVEQALNALPDETWLELSWRKGTKGELKASFAALRLRVADGPVRSRADHLPGDEVWVVGERRSTGERKFYLTNHAPGRPLLTLVAAIKARWSCEQAHQQLKEELGLDHFEGRSWLGLHHHVVLALVAFAFLQHLRLLEVARTPDALPGPPPQPTLPEVRRGLIERFEVAFGLRCSSCGRRFCRVEQFP